MKIYKSLLVLFVLCLIFSTTALGATTTYEPAADSYVQKNTPTTNYGLLNQLLSKLADWKYLLTRENQVMFDVSDKKEVNIISAKYEWTEKNITGPTWSAVNVFSVDTGWTETGVNWNNKPSDVKYAGTVRYNASNEKKQSIDVTEIVRDELRTGDGIIGFTVKNYNDGIYELFSRQETTSSKRPNLVIEYEDEGFLLSLDNSLDSSRGDKQIESGTFQNGGIYLRSYQGIAYNAAKNFNPKEFTVILDVTLDPFPDFDDNDLERPFGRNMWTIKNDDNLCSLTHYIEHQFPDCCENTGYQFYCENTTNEVVFTSYIRGASNISTTGPDILIVSGGDAGTKLYIKKPSDVGCPLINSTTERTPIIELTPDTKMVFGSHSWEEHGDGDFGGMSGLLSKAQVLSKQLSDAEVAALPGAVQKVIL